MSEQGTNAILCELSVMEATYEETDRLKECAGSRPVAGCRNDSH